MLVTILFSVYCALVLIAALLFLPKFAWFFAARRVPAEKKAWERRRISLVIPARDESGVIGALFDSIERQTYPREFFEVNVIVQSAEDPTVAMAEKLGANVIVVPGQKCKGDALDGFFRDISKSKGEAFVIVDADAVLSSDYVEECNNALEYDRQIFVTRKRVKNYLYGRKERSVVCNCSALIYPITDDLGNLYRAEKGLPLNFIGQGLMLRREVVEREGGWNYRSLTEDFELKVDSYLKGFTSMYYPHAVLYTEEAVTEKESKKRRLRWLAGYSQCDKNYRRKVKAKMKREKAPFAARYDFFWFRAPIFLFLIATVFAVVSGCILGPSLASSAPSEALRANFLLIVFPLLLTYFLLFIYGLLAASCYRDAFGTLSFGERAASLLVFPLYTLGYVPIYLKGRKYAKRGGEWKPTQRREKTDEESEETEEKRAV